MLDYHATPHLIEWNSSSSDLQMAHQRSAHKSFNTSGTQSTCLAVQNSNEEITHISLKFRMYVAVAKNCMFHVLHHLTACMKSMHLHWECLCWLYSVPHTALTCPQPFLHFITEDSARRRCPSFHFKKKAFNGQQYWKRIDTAQQKTTKNDESGYPSWRSKQKQKKSETELTACQHSEKKIQNTQDFKRTLVLFRIIKKRSFKLLCVLDQNNNKKEEEKKVEV